MTVTFSEQDLQLFSEASGDRNPLHMSLAYAQATSFGQPVVFGILGVLACLGELDRDQQNTISRVTADFHRPMFAGVSYCTKKSSIGDAVTLRLFDGTVNVLSLSVNSTQEGEVEKRFPAQPPSFHICEPTGAIFPKTDAAIASWHQLHQGLSISGAYHCDESKTEQLRQQFGLNNTSLSILETLLWSSYLVGMELPGESALFFRCVLDFPETLGQRGAQGFEYSAEIASLNQSIRQIKLRAYLQSGSCRLAGAQFSAFVRTSLPPYDAGHDPGLRFDTCRLTGKVALVLGASRGFGAALSVELARAGATVVAASRSPVKWASELESEFSKRIETVQVDVSDSAALTTVRESIESQHGRLDFLICNAFPPIPALRLEENALGRLRNYISDSLDLVLGPMCIFLDSLNASGGTLLVISSSAVTSPVRDWPHYVAAKSAIESLAKVAQLQFDKIKTLVFRPERMMTDMTNTPTGRINADNPSRVAHFLVEQLTSETAGNPFAVLAMSDGSQELSPAML